MNVFDPADREAALESWDYALRTKTPYRRKSLISPNGSSFYVNVRAECYQDGDTIEFLGTFTRVE